jgi:hypothetical protein
VLLKALKLCPTSFCIQAIACRTEILQHKRYVYVE